MNSEIKIVKPYLETLRKYLDMSIHTNQLTILVKVTRSIQT